MADIQFSVECITGGVHIRQRPLVYFYLYNRGANDEYAELSVWQLPPGQGVPTEMYTSQPILIPRGETFGNNYDTIETMNWGRSLFARIKLTSDHLVPSVHFVQSEAVQLNQDVAAYYGPSDFVRIELPRSPEISVPVVGPPL